MWNLPVYLSSTGSVSAAATNVTQRAEVTVPPTTSFPSTTKKAEREFALPVRDHAWYRRFDQRRK